VLFSANRFVSNGQVPDVTHVVYVDPAQYEMLSDLDELKAVGRAVGKLNNLLPKHRFILMGPGRWGSRGDIKLGVSVTYADICNASMLIEIARAMGRSVPEVSFGTHFFQDLVESRIRYLPLYPDEEAVLFNEPFLRGSPNLLGRLLPDYTRLSEVVRVIDVPQASGGMIVRVLLNAELDEALAVLSQPTAVRETAEARERVAIEPRPEEHWRWRMRMAEQIAARIDEKRFGVKGVYVFGSTKNATAGPGSDLDVIVHFGGTDEQRSQLELWLEGWSLALAEMNYLRTGYRSDRLLDVHFVTDEDLERQTSYAAKIGAVTDAARPLRLRTDAAPAE
jgi:predicted nucleotidyltransferase